MAASEHAGQSILLELALAIGQSLSPKTNAALFLERLVNLMQLQEASIWHRTMSGAYERTYQYPEQQAWGQAVSQNHPLVRKLQKVDYLCLCPEEAEQPEQWGAECPLTKCTILVFRIEGLGFVRLIQEQEQGAASTIDMPALAKVIQHFGRSIDQSMAHERLRQEQRSVNLMRQKMEDSVSSYQDLFENMNDALLIADEAGYITTVNRAARRILEYPEGDLPIYVNIAALVHPEDKKRSQRYLQQLRTEGAYSGYRGRIITLAGHVRHVEVNSSAVWDEQGRYIGSRDIVRDITAQVKAEEQLMVERDRLEEARQQAVQAQRAEQQFLANMSHEIRTPMNAVIGMAHLLSKTQTTPRQKEYLDALRFSANSLLGLIDNVLDLSKIEAGRMEFEAKPFQLQQLLDRLVSTFRYKLSQQDVALDCTHDPKVPDWLVGDKTRLTQILSNLLSNAIKFTAKGRISVRTQLLAKDHQQARLQFRVADTGVGVPAEKIELIFQNFKQAEADITRNHGGTGLGLAIVKQLVELQGGSITVQSREKKGSVFTVTLPFGCTQEPSLEERGTTSPALPLGILAGCNVLVVEDNAVNQKLTAYMLDHWQCRHQVADNGPAALALSKQQPFDFIIMDVHMPGMDGYEVTARLRADKANPNQHTRIIGLSAAALATDKKRALQAGMDGFLTKPFVPEQLYAQLAEGLSDKTSKHDLAGQASAQTLIDLAYLQEFSGGDNALIRDIVGAFVAEGPKLVESLQQAYARQDWEGMYQAAHRLKPSYLTLGMSVQQDLAAAVEQIAAEARLDPVLEQHIEQLAVDTALAVRQLEEEVAQL
ncbi:MAG: response regulator [Bacteroidetes bacterium]|jgi:PAS domain S-box-containing protein|nr:response regulator [Bacteroidota bacterium]